MLGSSPGWFIQMFSRSLQEHSLSRSPETCLKPFLCQCFLCQCFLFRCFKGLTEGEAALMIVEEARETLQSDLGIKVNWDDTAAKSPLGNFHLFVIQMPGNCSFFKP